MHFRRLQLALLTLLLTASPLAAQAQKNAGNWTEWETITPEGEEFTVTMPKNPTTEAAKFAYHKMELNTRLYLATSSAGPVVAVASFSGIKSNPAEYTEFARFNSYIDAFKDFFPPKVRTKDTAVTKLTLVSSMPFHGYTGRSYKISIGELSGTVKAFVTRKRTAHTEVWAVSSLEVRAVCVALVSMCLVVRLLIHARLDYPATLRRAKVKLESVASFYRAVRPDAV